MMYRHFDSTHIKSKILVEAKFDWLNDCANKNNTEEDIYFYHKDHLGSSTQITDKDAVVIHHIEYMPSGEQFAEQRSTWGTNYKFNSKELDQETGLYYYGARYYNPTLSIWGSVDPMSDKYPSMSPYMYCAGNPVVLVDPNGMDIINPYEEKKNQAEAQMNAAKTRLESYNGNKNAEGYNQAKKDYKNSRNNFESINDKYKMVADAITDLEKYNNDFYNELNTLEDKNGQCVDVYVEIAENLKTSDGQSALGSSNSPEFDGTNFYSKYGKNTTIVNIDKGAMDKGAVLAHEGGHKSVWIKAYDSMRRWYTQPSAQKGYGHDKGNPGGDNAKKQEDIYLNNKPKR